MQLPLTVATIEGERGRSLPRTLLFVRYFWTHLGNWYVGYLDGSIDVSLDGNSVEKVWTSNAVGCGILKFCCFLSHFCC